MRMQKTVLMSFFLVFYPLLLGANQAGVHLYFNDLAYSPAAPHVLLRAPGRANQLAVEVEPVFLAGRRLTVHVKRILPGGETIHEQGALERHSRRVVFELGPMGAPPQYDFEAGVVYHRGYRLQVRLKDERGRVVSGWDFYQGPAAQASDQEQGMGRRVAVAKPLRLLAGNHKRVVFDPKFGSLGPWSLRLGEGVLFEQDNLEILARFNAGEGPGETAGVLRVIGPSGGELWRQQVQLRAGEGWKSFPVPAAGWPVGDYRVELRPLVDGKAWPDGPRLAYRRRPVEKNTVLVSPVAPWKLRRNPQREEIQVTDFRQAHQKWGVGEVDVSTWKWSQQSDGGVALVSQGEFTGDPVVYRFPTVGYYAVFMGVEDSGCLIQVGSQEPIRSVRPSRLGADAFIAAADLSQDLIRIYPGGDPKRWLDGGPAGRVVSLRLVPVTARSVRQFYEEIGQPPVPLIAVNDWAVYFGPVWSRLLPDQFDSIVCGQFELGFRTIDWSVGRSWIEYHSQLPHTRRFPCLPYEEGKKVYDYSRYDYGRRILMINEYQPLSAVYHGQRRCGAEIWPWLPMQRHYGANNLGGIFACPFYREHPQWWRIAKEGSDSIGLSFYFPEVRQERLDILLEVARKGADGLVVGCDRQVPMLLYHPEMVQAYREKTEVDPLKIDASQKEAYTAWIRWRADFFTQLLRDLKKGLEPLGARTGKPIPVAVRIPSSGLFFNLAQGLDVEQWCREGLVDQLQLDPLEDLGGRGVHDVRPYLELGRRYGVAIVGGMGSTALMEGGGKDLGNLVAGLKRARGLLREGVDAIDAYETEMLALVDPIRFVAPLLGNPARLEDFLKDSNLEACFPLDAGTAAAGHDNHSRWKSGWDVYGFGPKSL